MAIRKSSGAVAVMILFFLVLPCASCGAAESETGEDIGDISLGDLLNLEVSVATKTKKSLRNVPAIVTVVTGDEIRKMGARYLSDVLKTVPGFGISIGVQGRYQFEVRGIRTLTSEKILLMLDGHRLNDSYLGSGLALYNNLPVENVKQIEIIRGPGSALYGANAFIGVINIIIKDPDETDSLEFKIGGGSFDTKKITLVGGKTYKKAGISCSADYLDTDGPDIWIESDRLDNASFSIAPGNADLYIEQTDFFLKAVYGDFSLRGQFTNRDRGSYIGWASALTDENQYEQENYWIELGYDHAFTDFFAGSLKMSYDHFSQDSTKLKLFPNGFPGYPEGMVGAPQLKIRTFNTELQFDADIFEINHLIFGCSYHHIDQYEVKSIANFDPWTYEPLGYLQDVSSWGNFNKEIIREVWALYFQGEWEIRENLSLTAGIRYDNYDDFGDTVNPRAGVVWNFYDNMTFKLLYGQAFRAPNFVELYNDGNPVAVGNPELDPEEIKTYEASLGYAFKNLFSIELAYFYNDIENIIGRDYSASPPAYANSGGAEVQGLEAVLYGKYGPADWKVAYCYQNPEDADTDEKLPYVPENRITGKLDYEISKYLNAHLDVLWTGSRPRPSGDDRGDISSYATANLSMIARNFYKGFEIRGTVYNLFDEDYEDPDASGASQLIMEDYPRPGISGLLEVSYKF